ncbi:hypothetical protein AB4188_07930, partial [Vibrio lentus]
FNPKELLSFAYWRDEHRQLVERHGRIDSPKFYPPKEHPLPFRGGHLSGTNALIGNKVFR